MIAETLLGLHIWLLIACKPQASSECVNSCNLSELGNSCDLYTTCDLLCQSNSVKIRYTISGETNVELVMCDIGQSFTRALTTGETQENVLTNSSQFSQSSQDLLAVNITSDIEGVYGCAMMQRMCVFVKGMTTFEMCPPFYSRSASCPFPPFPLDDTICIETVNVMEGENALLHTQISFTGTGGCGCTETIEQGQLFKYVDGGQRELISFCSDHADCLRPGRYDDAFENITMEHAGLYMQVITVALPRTVGSSCLYKLFNVTVLPLDHVVPTATPTATPMTTPTITPIVMPMVTSTQETSTAPRINSNATGTVAASVSISIVFVIICIVILATILFCYYRNPQVSWRHQKTSVVICAEINNPKTAEPSAVNRYSVCIEVMELETKLESSAISA